MELNWHTAVASFWFNSLKSMQDLKSGGACKGQNLPKLPVFSLYPILAGLWMHQPHLSAMHCRAFRHIGFLRRNQCVDIGIAARPPALMDDARAALRRIRDRDGECEFARFIGDADGIALGEARLF